MKSWAWHMELCSVFLAAWVGGKLERMDVRTCMAEALYRPLEMITTQLYPLQNTKLKKKKRVSPKKMTEMETINSHFFHMPVYTLCSLWQDAKQYF